jgi:hypothetical protein
LIDSESNDKLNEVENNREAVKYIDKLTTLLLCKKDTFNENEVKEILNYFNLEKKKE